MRAGGTKQKTEKIKGHRRVPQKAPVLGPVQRANNTFGATVRKLSLPNEDKGGANGGGGMLPNPPAQGCG